MLPVPISDSRSNSPASSHTRSHASLRATTHAASSARTGRAFTAGVLAVLASCAPAAPEKSAATVADSAQASAQQRVRTLEAPYVGAPDEPFIDCIHISISEWRCPETSAAESFTAASIASASVTYKLKDGRTITRTLPPDADAVFLTRGAARNFLLRYYKATAPDKATALEQRLQQPAAK